MGSVYTCEGTLHRTSGLDCHHPSYSLSVHHSFPSTLSLAFVSFFSPVFLLSPSTFSCYWFHSYSLRDSLIITIVCSFPSDCCLVNLFFFSIIFTYFSLSVFIILFFPHYPLTTHVFLISLSLPSRHTTPPIPYRTSLLTPFFSRCDDWSVTLHHHLTFFASLTCYTAVPWRGPKHLLLAWLRVC